MLQKIKKIWKNKWLILEGMFNYYFTRKKIKRVAYWRNEICKTCPLFDPEGHKCEIPGTQPCCGDCGCSLKYKTYSMSSACPQGRWFAVMTEEEEDALNAKLDINEIVAIEPDPEINAKNLFKSPKLEWRLNYPDLPEIDNLELTNELLDIANVCDTSCFFKNTALIEYYDNDRESRIAKGSIYTEADYQEVITDAAEVIEEALCKGDVNLIEDSTRKNIRDLYLYDYTLLKFWFDKYKPLIKFSAINWSSYGEDTVTIVFSFSDAIDKYQDYAITFKQVINKRELWR